MAAFSPKDYLDIADAYGLQLEKPFDFMQNRFDQYSNMQDTLRESYVENQRVPERLSLTAFNNRKNQYNLQELNQNWDRNLKASGLTLDRQISDDEFYINDTDKRRESFDLQRQAEDALRRSTIMQETAKTDFQNYKMSNPFDPSTTTIKEYFDDFYTSSNNNPLTKDLIDEELKNLTSTTLDRFSAFIDFSNKLNELTMRAQYATESQIPRLQGDIQSTVVKMRSAIESVNFEQLAYLSERGLLEIPFQAVIEAAQFAKDNNAFNPGIDFILSTVQPKNPSVQQQIIDDTTGYKGSKAFPSMNPVGFGVEIPDTNTFGIDVPQEPRIGFNNPSNEISPTPKITISNETIKNEEVVKTAEGMPQELTNILNREYVGEPNQNAIDFIDDTIRQARLYVQKNPELSSIDYYKERIQELNANKDHIVTMMQVQNDEYEIKLNERLSGNASEFYDYIIEETGTLTENNLADQVLYTPIQQVRELLSEMTTEDLQDIAWDIDRIIIRVGNAMSDNPENSRAVLEDMTMKIKIIESLIRERM